MKNTKIPLYDQIANLIRKKIKDNEWGVGDRVPAITELAAKYKISINTVRTAISKLEKEGRIIRLTDKQLYIANSNLKNLNSKHKLELSSHFTEVVIDQSNMEKLWCKIVKKQTHIAGEIYSKKFDIAPVEHILYVKKVLYVDKTPVAIEYIYIPKNKIPKIDGIDLSIFSFNEIYTLYGIHTKEIHQSLSTIQLDKKDAKLLNLEEGSVAMFLKSSTYDNNDALIELKKIYVNIDKISFDVNFNFVKK